MMNIHASGGKCPRGCKGRCSMCCGYTSPAIIAILIVALYLAHVAHMIYLITVFPKVGWKVFLAILFIILATPAAFMALFTYYKAIFTSPGFVPEDPWANPPRQFTGDPATRPPMYFSTKKEREGEVEAADMVVINMAGDERSGSSNPLLNDDANTANSHPHSSNMSGTAAGNDSARTQSRSPVSAGAGDCCTPAETTQLNPYWVVATDSAGLPRFCRKCNTYKPDNAHHCSACNKCVYNFDHHCPFINNCVGRNNYKLFLVFLGWSFAGCMFVCILGIIAVFAIDNRPLLDHVGWIAPYVVLLVLGFSLMAFFIEHLCLVRKGQATFDHLVQQWKREEAMSWDNPCGFTKTATLTEEERAEGKRLAEYNKSLHNRTLFGKEPWYKRIWPSPVRTDTTADDTLIYKQT